MPVLRPRDLLLCVQMGVPGERQYFPWEEFVWETGNESSPRALRVALSSRYGLSPDSLLLAKRLPEKHTWMPVSNWVSLEWGESLGGSDVCGYVYLSAQV